MMADTRPASSLMPGSPMLHLHYGFIPQSVMSRFQSPDYQIRVDASLEMLELTKNTPIESIEVHGLLHLIEAYVADQNYSTTQNGALMTSALISQLTFSGQPVRDYLHQIVRIVFAQFSDRRRVVAQLGQGIFKDLVKSVDSYDALSELVRCAADPSPGALVEILRCLTNLLSQDDL
jgi:hypothetical protein